MRVLEFYEGRDKRYTEELIYQDFFEEDSEDDNGTAMKVILEYDGKPIGYGQIYPITDEGYEEYEYDNRNETIYGMDQFVFWHLASKTE